MGLCKCPQRKVTNLFCFEHRINVCESCLISNHESCVVQTYLSWLTDSDYDPNCLFCSEPLGSKETIRLKCLHLFHWSCLNIRAGQLPNTTAPAGYKCPSCLDVIFPKANQSSPIVEKLKEKFQTVNWGRVGLGLPLIPSPNGSLSPDLNQSSGSTVLPSVLNIAQQATRSSDTSASRGSFSIDMHQNGPFEVNTFTSRSKLLSDSGQQSSENLIDNDSKYSKPVGRSIRSRIHRIPRSVRRIFLALLALAAIYIVIFFLTGKNGKSSFNDDPLFDPHANPHIRINSN